MKLKIIVELNKEGHIGHDKPLALIANTYLWPTMGYHVYRYIKTCYICQVSKGIATNARLYMPLSIPIQTSASTRLDFIFILHCIQRGNDQYFLLLIDSLKMAHFIVCKKTANALSITLLIFKKVYRLYDLPHLSKIHDFLVIFGRYYGS